MDSEIRLNINCFVSVNQKNIKNINKNTMKVKKEIMKINRHQKE